MFDDDDDFQQGQRKDNGFKVNRGFERKFNERKKREDLEKAKSKYGKNFEQLGKGEDDSSDSSLEEDDDARLDSDEVTLKLFSTISKLRQKKPEIYEKEKKFFRPDDLGDSTNIGKRSRADQPLTYKKLVRDRALAGDLGENDSEEDDQKEAEETPFEVQQRLKAEFKSAAKGGEKKVKKTDDMDEDEEEDDNFFKVKTKTKQQIKDEEDEFKRFVENQKKRDREDAKDLQKVWGDSNNLSEEDKFLRKYLLTKGWLEKSDDDDEGDSKDNGNEFKFGYSANTKTKKSKADTSDMAEENFTHAVEPGDPYRNWKHDQQLADEEDEARSEEVDQFEEKINFRYEQPGGNRLQTYERNNTDSLRVKDTKRAEKRKEKEERKEEEKLSFRKEVEHIKQLKKDEIERKIKQLMQAGGLSKDKSEKTLAKLMNEDFDDQAFDRQMNNVFNNDYYEDEEEDEEELKKYVEEVEEDVDKMIAGDDKEQAKGDKGAKGAGDEEEDVVLKPSTNVPITMKKKINKEEAEVLKTAMNDPLWWYCDQCGRGIKALEPRFDCMECEDYTECRQCAELKQHEHQMKKFIVPEGCNPPEDNQISAYLENVKLCTKCNCKLDSSVIYYKSKITEDYYLCETCLHFSKKKKNKKDFEKIVPQTVNVSKVMADENYHKLTELTDNPELAELIDDYYKIDFEDVIAGGLKTRFKYVDVEKNDFNLDDDDMLFADDRLLNRYLSVKKLAPYKGEE